MMSHSEKSYIGYIDMAILCWAATVTYIFSVKQQEIFTITTFSLTITSLLPLIYLLGRKYALGKNTTGALSIRSYGLIISEFTWKYAIFGMGVCIIQFSIQPELFKSELNRHMLLLIINIMLAVVTFFFQKVWSNRELLRSPD